MGVEEDAPSRLGLEKAAWLSKAERISLIPILLCFSFDFCSACVPRCLNFGLREFLKYIGACPLHCRLILILIFVLRTYMCATHAFCVTFCQ